MSGFGVWHALFYLFKIFIPGSHTPPNNWALGVTYSIHYIKKIKNNFKSQHKALVEKKQNMHNTKALEIT